MAVAATSLAAKRSLKSSVTRNLRGKIFRFLVRRATVGATLNEINEELDIQLQTVCARRNELGKMRLVIDSGTRRPTPSGRSAIVWIVPERVLIKSIEKGVM